MPPVPSNLHTRSTKYKSAGFTSDAGILILASFRRNTAVLSLRRKAETHKLFRKEKRDDKEFRNADRKRRPVCRHGSSKRPGQHPAPGRLQYRTDLRHVPHPHHPAGLDLRHLGTHLRNALCGDHPAASGRAIQPHPERGPLVHSKLPCEHRLDLLMALQEHAPRHRNDPSAAFEPLSDL